ncbi:uncharacterized protein LOC133797067 isoform X2 [Humulus lupulus]|uniref:uncharacterized protein LOC133797067 isoform X2 n=1 Tax=Humulus lupulus TaxID=3486 RepID=UPI002B40F85F|nr:uncharacterized protein LOC133797067 isoform X2 [Humulus lupulus]
MVPPVLPLLSQVLRPRVKQSAGRHRTCGGSSRTLRKSIAHKLPIFIQVPEMSKRALDTSEETGRSTLTLKKLGNMLKAHKLALNLKFIIPEHKERASALPKGFVAFSDSIIRSGGAFPLHPFFIKVLDYFELAPLQLSPNSWVMLSCLYVLYRQVYSRGPSISEVHYFFTLRENTSAPGFYILQKAVTLKGSSLVEGSISNRGSWKSDYFFTYSGQTRHSSFNTPRLLGVVCPNLKRSAHDRVIQILALSKGCKQASALFTESNLCLYGLLTPDQKVTLCSISSESEDPRPVSPDPASPVPAGRHPTSPESVDQPPAAPVLGSPWVYGHDERNYDEVADRDYVNPPGDHMDVGETVVFENYSCLYSVVGRAKGVADDGHTGGATSRMSPSMPGGEFSFNAPVPCPSVPRRNFVIPPFDGAPLPPGRYPRQASTGASLPKETTPHSSAPRTTADGSGPSRSPSLPKRASAGTRASPDPSHVSIPEDHPLASQYGEAMSHHLGNFPKGEWGMLHNVPEAELENAYMRASLQASILSHRLLASHSSLAQRLQHELEEALGNLSVAETAKDALSSQLAKAVCQRDAALARAASTSHTNIQLEASIQTLNGRITALEAELVNVENRIIEKTLHAVWRTNPTVDLSPFGDYAVEKISEWKGRDGDL